LMLNETARRMEQNNIRITFTEEAKEFLVDKGYDKTYGARPLKRTIQEYIEDKLAEAILDDRIKEGDNVTISYENDEITIQTNS
jgi:ATP-dependent Clp protease ATP-binding subunit ClpC